MTHVKLSLRDIWKETSQLVKENLKLIISVGAFMLVGSFLLELVTTTLQNNDLTTANFIWSIVKWVLQLYFSLVLIKLTLRLTDHETVSISQWKKLLIINKNELFRYFIVSFVYGLIVFAGIILLVIPSLIWGVKYMFAPYFAIDQQMMVKAALSRSSMITQGNFWKLMGLGSLLILINIIGALLLGVGLLITIPASTLATAVAFRMLQENTPSAKQTEFPRAPEFHQSYDMPNQTYHAPIKSAVNDYQI